MKSLRILFVLLVVAFAQPVNATVDILACNNITRELHWFEEDDYMGFGWNPLPGDPSVWHKTEQTYLEAGYTHTDSPYSLERSGAIAVVLFFILLLLIRRGINLLKRF